MWYIEITNKTKYRLEFDGKIAMQLNSPMFSDETSHSLYFTVKNTTNNRKAFGFINMPEITDNKSREYPCVIKADPLMLQGTIVVSYQTGIFNCYFKQNGDFWSAIKDKLLREIPFDITTFDPVKDYAAIKTFIEQYQESFDYDFTFPMCVNTKVSEKWDVRTTLWPYVNNPPAGSITSVYPIIPFFYIHAIYEAIFQKNGIDIGKNAFFNSFLSKLILPNNFLINEFYLNTTVVWQKASFICHITNDSEPVVTTVIPHGLANNGFVKLIGIAGMPIDNRIFQIELVDDLNFKILDADFSEYPEYHRNFYPCSSVIKQSDENYRWIRVGLSSPIIEDLGSNNYWLYFMSDEYSCVASYNSNLAQDNIKIYPDNSNPTDPDYDTHTYPNSKLVIIEGSQPHTEGVLSVLPALLDCNFKEINPANHVPAINIKDFLSDCKYFLGVIPFIKGNKVDIKTYKEIFKSSEFIDISAFSQRINNIENPNKDGYSLSMQADSADNYYKEKLPVQVFEEKYTVKDPVATKSALAYSGSETNDVRLVQDENSYYVFNKNFLNKDNNWTFFCYNLLDLKEGNGDLKISTKFSPLLNFNLMSVGYPQFEVNCQCRAFDSEGIKMAPRALIFYGIFTMEGQRIVMSNNKAWDENGIIPEDAFSLRWDGDYGIKEKLLKEYIEWELNVRKDCVDLIIWPMKLLANFDFSKKYRNTGIDYLIKSILFDMDFGKSITSFNETKLAKV